MWWEVEAGEVEAVGGDRGLWWLEGVMKGSER